METAMREFTAYQVWSILYPYDGSPRFHGVFGLWSLAADGRRGEKGNSDRYALSKEDAVRAEYHSRGIEAYVFTKTLRVRIEEGTLVFLGSSSLFGEDWEHPLDDPA